MNKKISLDITPGAYFSFALALLALPLNLVFGWLIAAAIHEIAHIVILNDVVLGVKIGPTGAQIKTAPISNKRECCAALAGPLANLITVGLYKIFPLIAICSCIQFLFNIMPVFPMDGGRAYRCFLRHYFSEDIVGRTLLWTRKLMFIIVVSISVFLLHRTRHIIFLLILIVLLVSYIKGKIPCKCRGRRVQ